MLLLLHTGIDRMERSSETTDRDWSIFDPMRLQTGSAVGGDWLILPRRRLMLQLMRTLP